MDLQEPITRASSGVTELSTRVRVVTATSLFDGHDAAINIVRRLLQAGGAEVIHLGHNRSVQQIVAAAIQEDAQAVAVSSYQGGHVEFFQYLRERLDAAGGRHVLIFGGGGGVVLPEEVRFLEENGVRKIFTPEDGRRLGLEGMIEHITTATGEVAARLRFPAEGDGADGGARESRDAVLARALTAVETGVAVKDVLARCGLPGTGRAPAVLGVTGTGGAGKSSLVDELVLRLGRDFPELAVAVLSVDPTRKRTGGALLGDRLRMNSVYRPGVFLRSFATRGSGTELTRAVAGAIEVVGRWGCRLVLVETAGIGQGNSAILEVAGVNLYVMTPEFGAPTQLEKIDMLDYADAVAVNKIDRQAGPDAVNAVTRQLRRLGRSEIIERTFGTCASAYNDPGVERLYRSLVEQLARASGDGSLDPAVFQGHQLPAPLEIHIIPPSRESYLAEAARTVREYRRRTDAEAGRVAALDAAEATLARLEKDGRPDAAGAQAVRDLAARLRGEVADETRALLEGWSDVRERHAAPDLTYEVRGREIRAPLRFTTLAGTELSRLSLPRATGRADLYRFLRLENLPGRFPFTAGVYPLRRVDENPTRQFAGEGTPAKTNRRFHLLCDGQPAKRLSTAFDSVTLYGHDPDERPDIYGKVGESGVSIATWEDMRRLFAGFDLCDPSTSVSMTINGPAPTILAMFFTAAIDQQVEKHRSETGREPSAEELERLSAATLSTVRGTVQADILKEDQAQNTCLFSTAFSLKMMGDVQEYFVERNVRNFYSVSISGYHIAEAGANPITQLAFTLANGLTYVEYYLSRGMDVSAFARNFSFFFSMGMDPEYSVIGRVARRVWAIVLRDRYGADERAQKLKYHIQTSGRSLHAREMAFNDIRTTLQAVAAYYDQCNSLHTNAYDEAVTTPTEESVRRAVAIQLIIQKELGTARSDNPLQGSYLLDELTDLVEEAVLTEFERISTRGGIPGAMETGYLRGKIQEESRVYEERKHSGELEVVGVNTFVGSENTDAGAPPVSRATREEKETQIRNLRDFQQRHASDAPAALARLKRAAAAGENTFAVLMDTVRYASLGEITQALFEVGGEYRRMM